MIHKIDFDLAPSRAIAAELGRRLNELRLAQDLTQQQLAERAGVSRRTVSKLAEDGGVSLDSFVRVIQALGLAGHLRSLLPDPEVRPVEMARLGRRRQRASGSGGGGSGSGSGSDGADGEWRWGDEGGERDESDGASS